MNDRQREHENMTRSGADQAWLDRLVDGEMTPQEYNDALAQLASEPDGWRRCALAFLEAQAWQREFRGLRQEAAISPSAPPVAASRSGGWLRLGGTLLACAASFLLAFGLFWQRDPGSNESTPNLVEQASNAGGVDDASLPGAVSPPALAAFPASEPPVGSYRVLVSDETNQIREVEMPVFRADDPRAGWLLEEYSSLPPELIRSLESQGNHVQRQRNWIPVPGRAGSPVLVPVDEIQVTPVSSRSFQ